MSKKTAKHEPVLLPPTGDRTPVQQGWIWFGLLVLGVVLAFWRDASFDPAAQRALQAERAQKVHEYQELQKKLKAENRAIGALKGTGKGKGEK